MFLFFSMASKKVTSPSDSGFEDDDSNLPPGPQELQNVPVKHIETPTPQTAGQPQPQPSTSNGKGSSRMMTRSKGTAVSISKPDSRKRKAVVAEGLEHPYNAKMDVKMSKLNEVLDQITKVAHNDLLIVDRDSGINVYDMNYAFADKLESVGRKFLKMQKRCTDQATKIRQRVGKFEDQKVELQDIMFIEDVPPKKQRVEQEYLIIKQEDYAHYVDTDSDIDEEGDWDTKFKFTKKNNNGETNYVCNSCEGSFRDKRELRNHLANHHKELYRCLQCTVVCRSERSFENHSQTHTINVIYKCPNKKCKKTFNLKTSLQNHLQKHTNIYETCDKCGKRFKYHSTYNEHKTYRHTPTKTVQCPVCKKYYWTPTQMRSHKFKKHGPAKNLYRGAI